MIELAVIVAVGLLSLLVVAELAGVRWAWTWTRRPVATLGNRNHVAQYLALATPVVAAAAWQGRRLALVALVVALAVIVVARCRGAYLALGVAVVVLAVVARALGTSVRPARAATMSAVVLGVTLGSAAWPGVHFTASVADTTRRVFAYDTGSGRVRIHQHPLAGGVRRRRRRRRRRRHAPARVVPRDEPSRARGDASR